jgi:hypothetical protein
MHMTPEHSSTAVAVAAEQRRTKVCYDDAGEASTQRTIQLVMQLRQCSAEVMQMCIVLQRREIAMLCNNHTEKTSNAA